MELAGHLGLSLVLSGPALIEEPGCLRLQRWRGSLDVRNDLRLHGQASAVDLARDGHRRIQLETGRRWYGVDRRGSRHGGGSHCPGRVGADRTVSIGRGGGGGEGCTRASSLATPLNLNIAQDISRLIAAHPEGP